MEPLVSVILPTYNRAGTIEKSIQSVLNQSYQNIELIVVDDGSSDNTREVVGAIDDSRLKYVYQDNAGACVARNKGIDHAVGQYIAFQDSDDTWHPHKLKKQMDAMVLTGADIVFCKLNSYVGGVFQGTLPRFLENGFVNNTENLMGIGTQSLLVKKEVFNTCKFDNDFPRWQDLEWVMRAVRKFKLYCVDEGLVDYYIGDDSISVNEDKLIRAGEIMIARHPDIEKNFPSISDNIYYALLNTGDSLREKNDRRYVHCYELACKYRKSVKNDVKSLLIRAKMYPCLHMLSSQYEKVGTAIKARKVSKDPVHKFKRIWREKNESNKTFAVNVFPIHMVKVGKCSYGPIEVILPNENMKINIGNYVSIGPEVKFLGGAHYYKRISTYPFQSLVYHEATMTKKNCDINIEDDVWIGYDTIIMEGVTIGKGAVIGARSIVAKDVPPYSIFVGNKVIKKRFSDGIIEKVKRIDFSAIEHSADDAYRKYCQVEVDEKNVDELLHYFEQ